MKKIILTSKINSDKYTEYVINQFDIQNREEVVTEIPYPNMEEVNSVDFNLLAILGQSGAGKSTILKTFHPLYTPTYDYDKCIISQFPQLSEEEVVELFNSVSLSSVPTWLKKPSQLSNGERARLDLAWVLVNTPKDEYILIDEFTSVVNRTTAKSLSYCLNRYVRNHNLKCIISSCHYDIIDFLKPDLIYNLNKTDGEGNVELEHLVYSDDECYQEYARVNPSEVLSSPREIKFE